MLGIVAVAFAWETFLLIGIRTYLIVQNHDQGF